MLWHPPYWLGKWQQNKVILGPTRKFKKCSCSSAFWKCLARESCGCYHVHGFTLPWKRRLVVLVLQWRALSDLCLLLLDVWSIAECMQLYVTKKHNCLLEHGIDLSIYWGVRKKMSFLNCRSKGVPRMIKLYAFFAARVLKLFCIIIFYLGLRSLR